MATYICDTSIKISILKSIDTSKYETIKFIDINTSQLDDIHIASYFLYFDHCTIDTDIDYNGKSVTLDTCNIKADITAKDLTLDSCVTHKPFHISASNLSIQKMSDSVIYTKEILNCNVHQCQNITFSELPAKLFKNIADDQTNVNVLTSMVSISIPNSTNSDSEIASYIDFEEWNAAINCIQLQLADGIVYIPKFDMDDTSIKKITITFPDSMIPLCSCIRFKYKKPILSEVDPFKYFTTKFDFNKRIFPDKVIMVTSTYSDISISDLNEIFDDNGNLLSDKYEYIGINDSDKETNYPFMVSNTNVYIDRPLLVYDRKGNEIPTDKTVHTPLLMNLISPNQSSLKIVVVPGIEYRIWYVDAESYAPMVKTIYPDSIKTISLNALSGKTVIFRAPYESSEISGDTFILAQKGAVINGKITVKAIANNWIDGNVAINRERHEMNGTVSVPTVVDHVIDGMVTIIHSANTNMEGNISIVHSADIDIDGEMTIEAEKSVFTSDLDGSIEIEGGEP